MGDMKAIAPPHWRPRKRTSLRCVIALLTIVAFGCEQGSERIVQMVGSAPGSTETAQPAPERTPGVPASTPPGTGDGTGGIEQPPGPGQDNPGPGTGAGADGASGQVGDTDGGDSGPGTAPGEGDRPGGLRLLAPRPPYEAVANEIYDLCDDQDAYAVLFARTVEPGEEITDDERDEIALYRVINEVSCDEPGGRRYVYVGDYGAPAILTSPEAAIADYKERNPYIEENRITHPQDIPLGYFGYLDWNFPLEDVDEVVLVEGSVLVSDGVVRGLVYNQSKTLFAREVTVTARPANKSGAQPVSGRFPLTVQPGERAFFEIEGWTGSHDPAQIELEVTAKLSNRVDISRAFSFGTGGTVTTTVLDEEFLKDFVPDFVYQAEKHKIADDGLLMIEYISVSLTAPTSHPSLEDQVLNQEIEDLRVYMALTGNGKVYDVVEPPLHVRASSAGHPHFYPPVISLPTYYGGAPFFGFAIVFIPEYSWHIWVGEPGPLDFNPRTLSDILPEPPPPTADPDWLPQETPQPIE